MTSSLEDWFKCLNSQTSKDPDEDRRLKEIAAMISVIAAAFGLSPREHEGRVREFISTQSDIWHAGKYAKEFSNIPELAELTKTPFMVHILLSHSLAFSHAASPMTRPLKRSPSLPPTGESRDTDSSRTCQPGPRTYRDQEPTTPAARRGAEREFDTEDLVRVKSTPRIRRRNESSRCRECERSNESNR